MAAVQDVDDPIRRLGQGIGTRLDLAQPRGVQMPYSVRPREDTPGLTLDFTATAPITAAYIQASG